MKQWGIQNTIQTLSILSVLLSGCTNNLMRTTMSGLSGTGAENYIPNTPNSVIISRAIPSQQATDAYDIIGAGDNALGTACYKVDASGQAAPTNDPVGASTCKCHFSYIRAEGTREEVETDTIYREADLIRCSMPPAALDLAVNYLMIKIRMTQSDSSTNELRIPVTGTGSGATSTSDIESYFHAHRYLCRDTVYVSHMLDPNVYDPIQSVHPELSYALNFYARNMGLTFTLIGSQGSAAAWDCPMLPNDSNAGLDLTLWSKDADSAGSRYIYPPAGSAFDRNTFYLAKKSVGGIFNVPIHAFLIPGGTSIALKGATDSDAYGYGASPIPSGVEQETCPDTVAIPSGYHWVKVWLMRASLPQRVSRTSTKVRGLGTIACNPGNWNSGSPIFGDCAGLTPANNHISDRIYGGDNMCFRMDASTIPISPCDERSGHGPGCTTKADGVTIYDSLAGYGIPAGTDVWSPSGVLGICGNPNKKDPMGLCGTTPGNVPLDNGSPTEWEVILDEKDQNVSRSDYVFVVTPPSVMAKTMGDSSKAENYPYIPFRFMAPSDCNSPDPDNPTPGDCPTSRKIEYGPVLHSIGQPGDPYLSDPANPRAGIFPICAIQPD